MGLYLCLQKFQSRSIKKDVELLLNWYRNQCSFLTSFCCHHACISGRITLCVCQVGCSLVLVISPQTDTSITEWYVMFRPSFETSMKHYPFQASQQTGVDEWTPVNKSVDTNEPFSPMAIKSRQYKGPGKTGKKENPTNETF